MQNEKGAIDALSVPTLADLIQTRMAADRLTPEQRDAVLAVTRAMTPTQETRNEDQDSQDPQGDPPADGATGTPRAPITVTHLEDHRAPAPVDEMLDRVTAKAERRDDEGPDRPLPFEPHELRAARDIDGPSQGEPRRRPGKDAGEENQDPGDDWDRA